jgi:hypothetical protein
VDIDEKKQDYFLNGLNDGLAYALEAHDFKNFYAMVHKTLVLENRREIVERKCKQDYQSQHSSNSMPRIGSSFARPIFCPGHRMFNRGHNQLDKDLPPLNAR